MKLQDSIIVQKDDNAKNCDKFTANPPFLWQTQLILAFFPIGFTISFFCLFQGFFLPFFRMLPEPHPVFPEMIMKNNEPFSRRSPRPGRRRTPAVPGSISDPSKNPQKSGGRFAPPPRRYHYFRILDLYSLYSSSVASLVLATTSPLSFGKQ